MSQLTDNLSAIAAIKSDIAAAIESKGVSMSGVSFGSYADKIGEIQTGGTFVTEPLNVTDNGVYNPGQGVDGYSQVTVNVPQSVEGYSLNDITSKRFMSESIISDQNITRIDAGTFCGIISVHKPGVTVTQPIPGIITTHYYFPNCTNIQDYGFCNNYALSYISIPNVSYIGHYVFEGTVIESIDLPSCEVVADNAFINCSKLESVNLPVCSYIGYNAFYNCSHLKSVYLLSSSKCSRYQYNVFYNTPSDLKVFVTKSLYSDYIFDNYWSDVRSRLYPMMSEFEFSNGLVEGSATSMNSGYLNILGISANDVTGVSMLFMESIASSTFMNHQNLVYISLPETQEFKDDTFNGCTSLSEVELIVSSIGDRVFANCTGLETVSINYISNVIQVGSDIFDNCPLLSKITVPPDLYNDYLSASGWSEYSSLMVTYMPELAFNNGLVYGSTTSIDRTFLQTLGITSNQVISVSLPECTSVGQSTFYEFHNLKDVYLPKCEYLSSGAFYGANYINGLDLPCCSFIGTYAFYWCYYSFSYLKLGYNGVCTLENANAFDSTGPLNAIYVPASLVETYKTATNWSRYAYKITAIPE